MRASTFERTTTYVILSVFSLAVLYPIISILFLALHRKEDLVTGFAIPHRLDLHSFSVAWDAGGFATGYRSSFIVAATVTVVSAVLSIGTGYAFGTMSFRGDRAVFAPVPPAAARASQRNRPRPHRIVSVVPFRIAPPPFVPHVHTRKPG